MSKKIILIIIFFSLSIVETIYADNLETISFISPQKSDWKITLRGYFSKPGLIAPNETIFSVTGESTRYRFVDNFTYRFTGRTGEKTFEMQYKFTSNISPIKKDEKVNMYLDDNLYHLSFSPFNSYIHTNCTEEDKVFLKMNKLQGNQFEYQIILPDCLKSK
jgi:hypothetical protein